LEADHRGINKFESTTDPNYIKVSAKLKRLVDSAPDILKRNQAAPNTGFRIIPYGQNDKFTGRESVSANLTALLSKRGHQRVALHGLGGVGKTQVALEYVYRKLDAEPECHIFWVNGGSWATFSRDYRNISTQLGLLGSDAEDDKTFLRLKNWLESKQQRWGVRKKPRSRKTDKCGATEQTTFKGSFHLRHSHSSFQKLSK